MTWWRSYGRTWRRGGRLMTWGRTVKAGYSRRGEDWRSARPAGSGPVVAGLSPRRGVGHHKVEVEPVLHAGG